MSVSQLFRAVFLLLGVFTATLLDGQTAPPTTLPPGTARVSSAEAKKMIDRMVRPSYPRAAKEQRIQGVVRMTILVNQDGKVAQIAVNSGPQVLIQECVNAVKQWTYKPLRMNDQPTAFVTEVEIPFEIF